MAKTKTFSELLADFLEYAEIEKNRSPLTLRNYHHYLKRFADFARKSGAENPEDLDLDLIRKYRLYINRLGDPHTGKPLKQVTQNYHIIALRAFLKYLAKRDIRTLSAEKLELGKTPSRTVEFLEREEVERLIGATSSEKEEILRLRDRAILETLFSTGLRVSELCSLKRDQINFKRGEFTVRGKGDKLRLVFLSPEAGGAVQEYLKRRRDNSKFLFVSHSGIGAKGNKIEKEMQSFAKTSSVGGGSGSNNGSGNGLAPRSVQRIVKKYALLAGIVKDVHTHSLRHSFATDLLRNGADIRSVQSMLGHSSITTTQIYTHITNQQLREIHQKFHNRKK